MNLAIALIFVIAVVLLYRLFDQIKCPSGLESLCNNQVARFACLVCAVWLVIAVVMPFLTRPRYF
jgi:L-asparagine transporter-like permease